MNLYQRIYKGNGANTALTFHSYLLYPYLDHVPIKIQIIHCASFVMLLSQAMALPFTMFAMAVRS